MKMKQLDVDVSPPANTDLKCKYDLDQSDL